MRSSIVVLVALAVVGCKKSTPPEAAMGVAPLTAEAVRSVDAVWYRMGPKGAEGGISEAKVILKPNPSGDVRVAVFEEFSGGAGNQWRASVWMSSFLAASTLRRQLTDYEFGVSSGGFIDGPSAGALITAAMLAGMRGVEVRQEATMTGTMNPDGTVGPVGGIPHKIEGAAAKGKKLIGYPVGQRYDLDYSTGQMVDLHQVAALRGVEVREIRDIQDAYHLLTGQILPRATAVDPAQMEISPRVFQRMQARTTAWLARAQSSMAILEQQGNARLIREMKLIDVAGQAHARAARYQTQGMVPVAFIRALEASVYAELAQRMAKQAQLIHQSDLRGMLLEVKSLRSVEAELDAFRATLATEEPTTASQQVTLISAYLNAAECEALIQLALEEQAEIESIISRIQQGKIPAEWARVLDLAGRKRNEALVLLLGAKTFKPTFYYLLARFNLEAARDLLDLAEGTGRANPLDPAYAGRLARSFASAAKANLDYYDSLILQRAADQEGASLAAAKHRKASDDIQYLLATRGLRIALAGRERTGLHDALATLAASANVYLSSASLVAKEYSLGAAPGPGGGLVVHRDKAFISMLELAEQKAREQAAVAKEITGAIPGSAQAAYQQARALREGDTDDKLRALSLFWASSLSSQVATHLAGSPSPKAVAAEVR